MLHAASTTRTTELTICRDLGADEGPRTLDLLHGNASAAAKVRPDWLRCGCSSSPTHGKLVVEMALDGVRASPRYPGGVALRFARVKGYRLDKNPEEADTITSLRALLPARAGDEFQASGPSKEAPNP